MSQLKAVAAEMDQIPVAGTLLKPNIERVQEDSMHSWSYDGTYRTEDTCSELQSLLAGIFLPFLRGR